MFIFSTANSRRKQNCHCHCSSKTQQIWKTPIAACINAGHTKTHDDRFSYRRPLPTPPTDHTKSSSAAPPQDHNRPAVSAAKSELQTTRRRYPQHPSQPTAIRVYSCKGSPSASVVLFSASNRPQYHHRPPTINDRQSNRSDRRQSPSSTDHGGPRLQQSRVRRQQQHLRRQRRRKQKLVK